MTVRSHAACAFACFVVASNFLCDASRAQASPYDFSYQVTGDRRVAPVQVFDDGRDTYFQFRPNQTVPAIFHQDAGVERLAAHAIQGSYVVVAGTAAAYVVRIGQVMAQAQYQGRGVRGSKPGPKGRAGGDATDDAAALPFVPAESRAWVAPASPRRLQMPAAYAPPSSPAAPSAPPAGDYVFDVAPADQNMRRALGRWARSAGWTFEAEHWTVDVDIPLAGSATFGTDFKAAARQLLVSTEMSARPLQPCFYSNRVLRVVPMAESCNRAAVAGSQGAAR